VPKAIYGRFAGYYRQTEVAEGLGREARLRVIGDAGKIRQVENAFGFARWK
jgi:hypothetical protein